MKTICVINTGGTISSVGDPLAPMGAAKFAAASQRIFDPIVAGVYPDTTLFYETSLKFPESSTGTLDSTNLQPTDWCLIAGYILDNYGTFDGFIILHGTDTMDFTGSALPFLLSVVDDRGFGRAVLSKAVIITGSQVPMYQQTDSDLLLNFNSDAFQNFCGAVSCARLGIPEVCVYFDSNLMRGNRVLKVNASGFRAFGSPNYPPLARIGIEISQMPDNMLPGPVAATVSLDDAAARALAIAQLTTITAQIDSFPVMPFTAYPAPYSPTNGTAYIAELLNASFGQGLKGLVLQSYGEGNFPSGNPDSPQDGAIYKALQAANEAGVLLVDSTQVLSGIVNDSAYASGAWLPEVGALGAFDMTPIAAVAKSTILLAAAEHNGWSPSQVEALVQTNLAGEVMNAARMDSRTNSRLLPGQSIAALDGSATLTNDPAAGPQLISSDGDLLWSPGQAGWLAMQNDGNLVLYSSDNVPVWATDTGVPSGASSVLMISGSWATGDLCLEVYDYSHGRISASLYNQARESVSMSQSSTPHPFRFSGRVAQDDRLHTTQEEGPDGRLIPPTWVSTTWGNVAQYAPTVRSTNAGYDPAGDCNGYFMSYRYQPNNNCYAYGCNIASNSFAQPGRRSGAPNLKDHFSAEQVAQNAVSDGLVYVGTTLDSVHEHAQCTTTAGHYVALMFSEPESNIGGDPNANWPGDYHWSRCDDLAASQWSQKDGGDQVTNFDFAGNPITNPATANWRVNQGPIGTNSDTNEYLVSYDFYCFMFVPDGAVDII